MSDFLFAQPSFITGAGRVLDLVGLFDEYNVSRDGSEADAKALYADFRAVGGDIADAMAEVASECE